MTEKNEAELKIARRVLGVWEEKYFELSQELRQTFLKKPHLTRLVNVSEDTLRHAIAKYQDLDDMIPYALAVQVETFRRELTNSPKSSLRNQLERKVTECERLREEITQLQDRLDKRGPHPLTEKTIEALREQRNRYKRERDEFKKERDQLENRLKRQNYKSAMELQSKNSTSGGHIAEEESRNKKPSAKRSPSQQPKPKEKPSSQAGVAHKASGFSGKPRQMIPEFDDTERCTQCGARISASAAALHDCS